MKSWSKYLDLPGKQYAVRPSVSISSLSMRKFIQFGISDDEERYLLYQAKHGDSPSEQSAGIENGKGQETHPKVAVIEGNPKLQTPTLVITAAEDSNLTMDMDTWAVLNLHIGEDQPVDLIPAPPAARSQANHGPSCQCSKCRNAAEMGDYFKRAMVKNDGQPTVRVFTEVPSSDPDERALLFPTEHTISTKQSSDSLRSTYMAQGGELQDLRSDPLATGGSQGPPLA